MRNVALLSIAVHCEQRSICGWLLEHSLPDVHANIGKTALVVTKPCIMHRSSRLSHCNTIVAVYNL